MKVLVTGAAGFIGSHLVRALLDRGDEVAAIDDLSTGLERRIDGFRDRVRFVRGDIRDASAVDRAAEGCDVVLHQAAIPSVARSVLDPLTSNSVNAGGTIQVMLAAARQGCRRVVLAGSSSVYVSSPGLPRVETQLPHPESPYAVGKLAAEGYVQSMGELLGIETVVLRYFNIFGPDQDPLSAYAAVVPRFITAALADEPLVVYGDGSQSRDFTYVDNVVAANLLAIEAPGAPGVICNIGCGGRFTLNELITAIGLATGRSIRVEHAPVRPGDVPHSQASVELAARRLGYSVAVPFAEGIRRSVAWYEAALADGAIQTGRG